MRVTRFRIVTMAIVTLMGTLAALAIMLRHEPAFYRRVTVPAGLQRTEMSNTFLGKKIIDFYTSFVDGTGAWNFTFLQDEINSYLEEDFFRHGDAKDLRNMGVTNPRLEFADNQIRLGFRYGSDTWNTVLSYDLRVWLVPGETNALGVEIQQRRAGALPIPTQHIFQELKDIGRRSNIDIEWYRHNGNPVAIVKFQCDRPRPTARLRRLEIVAGKLELQGFSLSFEPVRPPLEEAAKKTASLHP
jgi:hypothetical protein